MRSEQYLEITGFDHRVGQIDRDEAPFKWALGAEVVLLAAMNNDHDKLGMIHSDHALVRSALNDYGRTYLPPASLTRGRLVLDSLKSGDSNDIHKVNRRSKHDVAQAQIIALSAFLRNKMIEQRGEDVHSFNKRTFKTIVLPTMRPYILPISRRRLSDEQFAFTIGQNTYTEDIIADYEATPLAQLHSAQLEFDVLSVLFQMVIEKELPFIPIFAGPNSENIHVFKEEANPNSDILLIKEDASEIIPIQVKVKTGQKASRYEDCVVLIDNQTLATWQNEPYTATDEGGTRYTAQALVYKSGHLSEAIAMAYRKNQHRRGFAQMTGNKHAVDNVYAAIRKNPHHRDSI